ncbi:spore coat protein U domain-containing protein [Psychrobacter vallis]|uniref:spore coat protein U domain-containing protein n=1 Tax=Psychrobacter vallis TaxID=248451 RepID=UPI00191845FA|nr:spore coat protein U domain-containing protein [Psychrobacter vallis]
MTFNKKLLAATLVTAGGFAAISSANAATDSGAFDVELAVTATCSVTSVSGTQDIDFGSYAAGVDVTEASSSNPISVNCSNGTAYNIGLEGSGFLTDTVVPANQVAYSLLKTTGGDVWGNTATEVGGSGTGMATDQAKTHTVFASLVAGSTNNLPVGIYKDNVTVTVTY